MVGGGVVFSHSLTHSIGVRGLIAGKARVEISFRSAWRKLTLPYRWNFRWSVCVSNFTQELIVKSTTGGYCDISLSKYAFL